MSRDAGPVASGVIVGGTRVPAPVSWQAGLLLLLVVVVLLMLLLLMLMLLMLMFAACGMWV